MGSLRLGAAAALLGAAALAAWTLAAAQTGGDAKHGKELYYRHGCYGCHGYNGETGAHDLVGTRSPILAEEAAFVSFLRLRADQAPVLPSTRMPNFPVAALSDADARDLYAYVRTFRLDAPRAVDVPTLKAILDAARPAGR